MTTTLMTNISSKRLPTSSISRFSMIGIAICIWTVAVIYYYFTYSPSLDNKSNSNEKSNSINLLSRNISLIRPIKLNNLFLHTNSNNSTNSNKAISHTPIRQNGLVTPKRDKNLVLG